MTTDARPGKPLRFETVQDYLAWAHAKTEPGRTELDDGEVVNMAAQTVLHLRTEGRVYAALARHRGGEAAVRSVARRRDGTDFIAHGLRARRPSFLRERSAHGSAVR